PITVTPLSGADELMKWKKLLDQGIITKEEFEAQKKKILEK
ncbi:MAG: Short C-terminal domain, partial [Bacteroidetes bacterium]|nr:Short C-terminal domain [Bacteroidota bacterium]